MGGHLEIHRVGGRWAYVLPLDYVTFGPGTEVSVQEAVADHGGQRGILVDTASRRYSENREDGTRWPTQKMDELMGTYVFSLIG